MLANDYFMYATRIFKLEYYQEIKNLKKYLVKINETYYKIEFIKQQEYCHSCKTLDECKRGFQFILLNKNKRGINISCGNYDFLICNDRKLILNCLLQQKVLELYKHKF